MTEINDQEKGRDYQRQGGPRRKGVSSIWNILICKIVGFITLDLEPEQSSKEPHYWSCRIENRK